MKRKILAFLTLINLLSSYPISVANVGALSIPDSYVDRFAEEDIVFYDPCSNGGNSGNSSSNNSTLPATGDYAAVRNAKNANESVFNVSSSSEWYASFSDRNNSSMANVLEHYGDLAYQLGKVVGAPWVAIIVQMRYEDPSSDCGKNNFWGNGCPPGTPTGGASRQGANLGEGFQLYGQTLTSGRYDSALGMSDPKKYLETIGPMWVQGNANGAGYAHIESMKKSIDALQAFIDSAEGQAIVQTFGSYSGSSNGSTSIVSSKATWKDGWIESGIDGYKKESAVPGDGYNADESDYGEGKFSTSDGKPNKILLHSTEGTTSGIAAYPQGNHYPAHFTIDLKDKNVSQHFPVTKRSMAIAKHDALGPIQIEIVGFSDTVGQKEANKSSEYYLPNFSDADWDYLATLLVAISSETGIPLTSSVKWVKDGSERISSSSEFKSYSGILGHQHATDNDHNDPGDIWDAVSAAISRAGGSHPNSNNPCGNGNNNQSSIDYGELIAKTAIKYAWPYLGGDDGGEAGKCDPDGSGNLVVFDKKYTDNNCRNNPKPSYKSDTFDSGDNYSRCNAFVETVVIKSGADTDYEKGPSSTQKKYLEEQAAKEDGKWEKVDINSLKPGDVGVKDGHVAIYVGSVGGDYGVMAQGSRYDTVPIVSSTSPATDLTYYRIKSSGTCNLNSLNGEGCTFYCQGGNPGRESWADTGYGNCGAKGTYSWSGCGPTSLAMTITNLTGNPVTPLTIGEKSVSAGGRVCGSGSVAAKLVTVVKDYGLTYETIGFNVDAINSALDAGKVVWFSGKGSKPFSSNGHFIAIRGKTSDGQWLLFDSAGGCSNDSYTPSKKAYNPQSIINAASIGHTGPYAISK